MEIKDKQKVYLEDPESKKIQEETDPQQIQEKESNHYLQIFRESAIMSGKAKIPRNIVFLSIFLTVCGFGLIIAGLVIYSKYNDAEKCIAYWIIGGFCAVPGCFYTGKIIKILRTTNEDEKKDIINEIPEWN